MKMIARYYGPFDEKFGIPRQAGLAAVKGRVVLEGDPEALKGLEEFSHIWLIWRFREASDKATTRPPRLGGNVRKGVFATRSPYRPNPIGLSCVRLLKITGRELLVEGADLLNGTDILDIKPYVPYTDSHPEALCGFSQSCGKLQISDPAGLLEKLEDRDVVKEILCQDPRPQYIEDESREYGMDYAGVNIRFQVTGDLLVIKNITKISGEREKS